MTNETNWIAFSYDSSNARIFNCNAIIFHNISETQIITINDIYVLKPNEDRELRSQYADKDITMYQFTIPEGGVLQGWYKMDQGAWDSQVAAVVAFNNAKLPEMRSFAKQYHTKIGFPKSAIDKAFNMDITGYYR